MSEQAQRFSLWSAKTESNQSPSFQLKTSTEEITSSVRAAAQENPKEELTRAFTSDIDEDSSAKVFG